MPATAAEPGRWRTDRTPYLRSIMDCLSPSDPTERIIFIKGAQVGGTEAGLNWVAYAIHHAPGLMMLVQPSLDMAKRNTVTRLDPMIAATPALRDLVVAPRSREAGNSMFRKAFPAGELILTGANSAASLRSTPARYLFLDEVDGFPGDADGEGDPVDLAVQRTATFRGRRKILMVSTPTLKGLSRIEAAYLESDQRIFEVPCDHCGAFNPITWADIRWPDRRRDQAYFACPSCGGVHEEHRKPALLAAGKWTATAEGDGKTAGFHLSGLYSPWATWAEIALEHERVKKDPTRLQVWTNTRLGETWEDVAGEPMGDSALMERAEPMPTGDGMVPDGVLVLTCGVDVQPDRLECTLIGWGAAEEAWVMEHVVLAGDPNTPALWATLDEHLGRTFQHPTQDVAPLPIRAVAIDSGGANTLAVYDYCRTRQPARRWAIKGVSRTGAPLWPRRPSKNNKGKVPLYIVNVDAGKDALAARLRISEAGPGCIHFADTLTEEYFKQLTAERVRTRYSRGRPVREWYLPGGRNEALDTFVYAHAALEGLKASGLSLEREAAAMRSAMPRRPGDDGASRPAPRKAPVVRSAWVSG
ncbi:phage terminase large subunit family protein [uncultured Rhodospira sp.]|uniref:phage terminase large subunit family protein n=1 Tax=uncultured Rhodospira sp. TaxID=1936189 RepID=UPI002625ED8C|nr:phage terminase large subunit family protein [uncultured Rhodospira sp.]